MFIKLGINHDKTVEIITMEYDLGLNEEHKKSLLKVIDLGEREHTNGICKDDLKSEYLDCWVYNEVAEEIELSKEKLLEAHLESFRANRKDALGRIDYKMLDAVTIGDFNESKRLYDIKQYLKQYPDDILTRYDSLTIDYLKSLPEEIYLV